MNFFNLVLINPLLDLLLNIFSLTHDFGWAIILTTVLLKFFLLPFAYLAHREEGRVRQVSQRVNRETKGIKDMIEKSKIIQNVYAEEKFNPMKNFGVQIIQLPIFIGFIAALNRAKLIIANPFFLGLIDLRLVNFYLALLAFLLQFLLIFSQPAEGRKIAFIVLFFIGLILFRLPAIFTVYWLALSVFILLERKIFHWHEVKFAVKPVSEKEASLS